MYKNWETDSVYQEGFLAQEDQHPTVLEAKRSEGKRSEMFWRNDLGMGRTTAWFGVLDCYSGMIPNVMRVYRTGTRPLRNVTEAVMV